MSGCERVLSEAARKLSWKRTPFSPYKGTSKRSTTPASSPWSRQGSDDASTMPFGSCEATVEINIGI
eukprot:2679102-Rhodomonas_salina.6